MHPLGLAALLAACYAPTAQPGAPCGPGGECPSGQDCRAGVCVASDSLYDAATGLVDGPAPDATLDAPAYVAWSTPIELSTRDRGHRRDRSVGDGEQAHRRAQRRERPG